MTKKKGTRKPLLHGPKARTEWLRCLHVAAVLITSNRGDWKSTAHAADFLYGELQSRCAPPDAGLITRGAVCDAPGRGRREKEQQK